MKDILDLEIRKTIYNILISNPGIHLSKIAEHAHLSVQLVDYHLRYMEHSGLISVTKDAVYKRYYIKGKIPTVDKKVLSLLQHDKMLDIVVLILKQRFAKPSDIRQHIDIAPNLLTYYLKKLQKYNLIQNNPQFGKKAFVIVDEQRVMKLLIQFKHNIVLERFSKTWIEQYPFSTVLTDKKKETNSSNSDDDDTSE